MCWEARILGTADMTMTCGREVVVGMSPCGEGRWDLQLQRKQAQLLCDWFPLAPRDEASWRDRGGTWLSRALSVCAYTHRHARLTSSFTFQYPPLPVPKPPSLIGRSMLMKAGFMERLWRIEFCRSASTQR